MVAVQKQLVQTEKDSFSPENILIDPGWGIDCEPS